MTSENNIDQLRQIIQTLRGENGCPWDKKQTPDSLVKYLREETDELVSAIKNADIENMCEEIGDVLYVLLMLVEISEEEAHFTCKDVVTGIVDKLIRRHPHVFADAHVANEEELHLLWNSIKEQEKKKNV